MPETQIMSLLIDKRFRANQDYELFSKEQLINSDFVRPEMPPLDAPLYGYLCPKPSSHLTYRQVSPDTALLFLTLRCEGPVPDYFRALFGRSTDSRLLRLILDGVLEVEHEGAFVSGPGAREFLLGNETYSRKGHIAELSNDALRYIEALGDLTIPEMTQRLYDFGRQPVTPAQKRAFHHAEIDAFGGLLETARPILNTYWAQSHSVNPYWMMWRPMRNSEDSEQVRFKLYISPRLSDVAVAFQASAEILGQIPGVRGLKLGRGLPGLTRSDKLVAYFSRIDDLQEAGWRLYRRLEGCSVHGVPFSAELSPDGLLSWGADPPKTALSQPGSWRLWLACRLATHFETARRANVSGPIWRFVLDRLRLDGVNPDTWMPNVEFWSSPASAI
jgi:hypothetical protein